jgi:hypothetical protein
MTKQHDEPFDPTVLDQPKRDDGGPAFPRERAAHGGMSLRDYFAAHAPTEYPNWYAPTLSPRPAPLFDHDHPNERQCQREFDCRAVNADELSAYDDERRRQYELQWPYAYADAMIAERKKPEGR